MQKIVFISHFFFENISKLLQTCYFGYYGHAWPHPPKAIAPTCKKLWCLSTTKNQLDPSIFWELYFKESYNPWLVKIILGNNSRTRIWPDMGFATESQKLKELSFCIVLRKNKWQNFQKNAKYPFSEPFFPKFRQKLIVHTNWAPSLFSIYGPLTPCKKTEKKLMSQFWEKLLTNRGTN